MIPRTELVAVDINENIKSNKSFEMELLCFIKQIFGDYEGRKFHLNYSALIFLKSSHRPN
jgi:hypothetical protein